MNPMMIAAVLFELMSMGANIQGQDQVNDWRKKFQKEAEARRLANREAAEAARQRAVTNVQDTGKNVEQAAESREQKYLAAEAPATTKASLLSPEDRGSSAVVNEEARQKGQAKAFTGNMANKRAGIDALGDVFLQSGLLNNEAMRDIRMEGDFATGWAGRVLPWQLNRANHMGDENFMLGQLFQQMGQLAASGAGNMGGNAATPGTTSVPFFGSQMPATLGSGANVGSSPFTSGYNLNPTGMDINQFWQLPKGY